MVLLVDNYDSFVYNLARYFARLGQETHVVRNDRISPADVRRLAPRAIVLSPGPCAPDQAGASLDIVRELHRELPMLGVCLGHQAIAQALGGRIIRAQAPMHGRTSRIQHAGQGIFAGLPPEFTVCRYHSLVVEEATLPAALRVTARTADGAIMALQHVSAPIFGVQFHPEAILTEHGYPLLAAFLRAVGATLPSPLPTVEDERTAARYAAAPLPTTPVTF